MELDIDWMSKLALMTQRKNTYTNISGHKVGACLAVRDHDDRIKYFTGMNIEISTSLVFHAERVALISAMREGYTDFLAIGVTSKDKAQATMCGYCRQDYMYINPEIEVIVFNSDGSVGIREKLIHTMNYPYKGTGKWKRQ